MTAWLCLLVLAVALGTYVGVYLRRHQSTTVTLTRHPGRGIEPEIRFPTLVEELLFWPARRLHQQLAPAAFVRPAWKKRGIDDKVLRQIPYQR